MAVEIKWLSYQHAWFMLRVGQKCVHIDPAVVSTTRKKLLESEDKADLILVTHAHGGHCKADVIEQIRGKKTIVIAADKCLEIIGGEVHAVVPGESEDLGWVKIQAVHAYNVDSADPNKRIYHRKADGVGYLIHMGGVTIYHAGDTDFIPEMRSLGPVDIAILPIGGTFTMDIAAAIEAAKVIQPRFVIPMHNLETDLLAFKQKLESQTTLKAIILKQDESFVIEP